MKVVIGYAKIGSPDTLSYVKMVTISVRQNSFIFFCAKKVYRVYCTVLLCQMSKMSLKCWLRCLGSGNLDTLTKCLKTLLLPEYYIIT